MRDFAIIIQGTLSQPLPFPYMGAYEGQEHICTRKRRGSVLSL
jgi:hypothetical protein